MGVVYYKFKSAKYHETLTFEGRFISLGQFKQEIFDIKQLAKGTDYDLIVTDARTNQEYLDEGMLIPRYTSLLIQRIPGPPRMRIVVTDKLKSIEENYSDDNVQAGSETSAVTFDDDMDWHDFGNDSFATPGPVTPQSSIPALAETPLIKKDDEDKLIKLLIETPTSDSRCQPSDSFGQGMTVRNMGGRGFGRVGFEKKTPPEGYICHRCKVPGHLIQHCPTNGDPTFDIKRVISPTGIPKPMLVASPDGPYALPSGAHAVTKPNETEIEGVPSSRSVCVLPPELLCPVCKEVMKDAALTKCCFSSFCDRCIRDHIISKSMCVCGSTNILADNILPNKTLRDTISRILESKDSSDEYSVGRSRSSQARDMESYNPLAKVPSPTQSTASREQKVAAQVPSQREESSTISEHVSEEKGRILKVSDSPDATCDSRVVNDAESYNSALVEEEVKQIPISGEAGKKKIKKKASMNPDDTKLPCRSGQGLALKNYVQKPGFDGLMPPLYPGQMPPYYTGYGPSPMDIAFRGMLPPQDPFGAMRPYGVPFHMQRDLSELETPVRSRERSEARKAGLKRKRERDFPELWKRSKQCC